MKNNISDMLIWVRGAGEIGSAVAVSLFRCGFRIILSEIRLPLAIRRTVTFSDAILDGETSVEGIKAKRMMFTEFQRNLNIDFIPIFPDNPIKFLSQTPSIIMDARMIKSYERDYQSWAKSVVGFGPGFSAKNNCHCVIETMRGHNLGKIIHNGEAMKNTGTPGEIGGETTKRVIYSPGVGKLTWNVTFGESVNAGQCLGSIDNSHEILSPLDGMVRGLIHPMVPMKKGLKIADVDPRGKDINFMSISDKARSLGRASLEAVMISLNNNL